MKVKTGDKVKIITGKDNGKEGVVTQVLRAKNKVVVEGLNQYKRHVKMRGDKGQIVEFAAPMDASNVSVISSEKKTTKKETKAKK